MKSVKPTDNIEYKNLQHFTVAFKKNIGFYLKYKWYPTEKKEII
jgi:hypothetical protein